MERRTLRAGRGTRQVHLRTHPSAPQASLPQHGNGRGRDRVLYMPGRASRHRVPAVRACVLLRGVRDRQRVPHVPRRCYYCYQALLHSDLEHSGVLLVYSTRTFFKDFSMEI